MVSVFLSVLNTLPKAYLQTFLTVLKLHILLEDNGKKWSIQEPKYCLDCFLYYLHLSFFSFVCLFVFCQLRLSKHMIGIGIIFLHNNKGHQNSALFSVNLISSIICLPSFWDFLVCIGNR